VSLCAARGEVWYVDFGQTVGHEQAGLRPVVVVSVDLFNESPAEMIVIVPITSHRRGIVLHVPTEPPEGGTTRPSVIMCDNVRAVSKERLVRRLGAVSSHTLAEVEDRLRVLLGL
jgi:mRNA interferase MazF